MFKIRTIGTSGLLQRFAVIYDVVSSTGSKNLFSTFSISCLSPARQGITNVKVNNHRNIYHDLSKRKIAYAFWGGKKVKVGQLFPVYLDHHNFF